MAAPTHESQPDLDHLAPASVKRRLTRAALFLMAYELMKGEIVDKVKNFYLVGFDDSGPTTSPDYNLRVPQEKGDTDRFKASCRWLIEAGALQDAHFEELQALRRQRNELAHELPRLVMEPGNDLDASLVERVQFFVGRLGRFWGGIEADISGEFDDVDVDRGTIQSGTMLVMTYVVQIVEGEDQT